MGEYKVLVLYKTKHGSTKKYAGWIGDALNADVSDVSEKDWEKQVDRYDMIIYGGNLNEKGINGIANFRAKMTSHPDKKVVYFAVGSFPPSEDTLPVLLNSNFPERLRKTVKLFHFRGRLDFLSLGFWEKFLMRGVRARILEKKKKEELTSAENEILLAFEQEMDWSDKNSIQPLVDYVKSFLSAEQIAQMEEAAEIRMKETALREEEESAAWEAEQKRREALFLERQKKDKEFQLRRLTKKQREQYEQNKARREAAERAQAAGEKDIDYDFLSDDEFFDEIRSEEAYEDDYSDFYDDDENAPDAKKDSADVSDPLESQKKE